MSTNSPKIGNYRVFSAMLQSFSFWLSWGKQGIEAGKSRRKQQNAGKRSRTFRDGYFTRYDCCETRRFSNNLNCTNCSGRDPNGFKYYD
jgi:hypothetical protein